MFKLVCSDCGKEYPLPIIGEIYNHKSSYRECKKCGKEFDYTKAKVIIGGREFDL